MAPLASRKLMPSWGIEVDHDLSQPLTEEIAGALVELFDDHHLLLFRRQTLSEEQQVAFARLFGPISHRSPAMKSKDTVLVSNVALDGVLGDGELLFHSDNTFFQHPLKAIGLYAMAIPSDGGDTLFSNAYQVYESLPTDVQRRLQGLTSLQAFDYAGDYNKRSSVDAVPADAPMARHPLLWTNPATGRTALFLSEHTTLQIDGVASRAEEDALIALLRRHIANPRFCYRHRWTVGDFVFWDNVCLQHARETFDRSQARTLRRTPVLDPDGDRRFPQSLDLTRKAA
ncbi:MAG: TauD/TfdA dioxygenase family protein [Reyranella sp.]|uniref:TauD/TfdA dioxygenase family protein n=1 Tax=Reyranella sp. TaxID=1929291 RepID=UPI003D144005